VRKINTRKMQRRKTMERMDNRNDRVKKEPEVQNKEGAAKSTIRDTEI